MEGDCKYWVREPRFPVRKAHFPPVKGTPASRRYRDAYGLSTEYFSRVLFVDFISGRGSEGIPIARAAVSG